MQYCKPKSTAVGWQKSQNGNCSRILNLTLGRNSLLSPLESIISHQNHERSSKLHTDGPNAPRCINIPSSILPTSLSTKPDNIIALFPTDLSEAVIFINHCTKRTLSCQHDKISHGFQVKVALRWFKLNQLYSTWAKETESLWSDWIHISILTYPNYHKKFKAVEKKKCRRRAKQ